MNNRDNVVFIPNDKQKVSTLYNINVSSYLYSSVFGTMRKYIKDLFPKDFFKSEFIGNSIFTVDNTGKNDDAGMVQERPSLAMTMNYTPESDATFTMDPFYHANLMMPKNTWLQPNVYSRIAWDRVNGIFITAPNTRAKHSFDVTITLNSELQAVNIYGFLVSRLGIERPFYLNKRVIEVPIPSSLIASIAAAKGIDLKHKGNIEPFNKLLSEISNGIISYKLNKSSGKYLYFFRYRTNILFTIKGIDSVDKEVSEKSITKASLKFSFTVEYTNHTSFIAESYQNLPEPDTYGFITDDVGTGVVLHSTMVDLPTVQLDNGKKVVFVLDIVTDVGEFVDVTGFEDHLEEKLRGYINYLKVKDKKLELVEEIFEPRLYCDGELLEYKKDYFINWDTMELELENHKSNYDYRFILYTDLTLFNEFLGTLSTTGNI